MARKRVIEAQSLKSWEDVNDALRQIAEAQIALGDIESDMQKQIVGAKKVAEDQSKPYKDAIARLEHELKEFVSEHRTDMGKTKTMTLTSGRWASGSPRRSPCPRRRRSWRRSSGG